MTGYPLRLFILLAGLLVVVPSCGKKAPPFLPKKAFSLRVSALEGEWREEVVFLRGRIDGLDKGKETGDQVKGCRIFYGQYPVKNPPCETCPIKYEGYQDVGPEVVKEESFFCRLTGKVAGRIYFFKVHLIGKGGVLGPASERLRLVVK